MLVGGLLDTGEVLDRSNLSSGLVDTGEDKRLVCD